MTAKKLSPEIASGFGAAPARLGHFKNRCGISVVPEGEEAVAVSQSDLCT